MRWRTALERVIPEAARELATVFGEALRTLVLYGRALRDDHHLAGTAVDFAVVAAPLTFEHLQRTAQWSARWRSSRVATPLLLSAEDLARSCDVFPLEFLDIKEGHKRLIGDDLFARLPFNPHCIRTQCEREAKGKLLRLRALYLECDSIRDLRGLMVASHETFLLVVRGLLYLSTDTWIANARGALTAFEQQYHCRLPIMAALAERGDVGPIEQRFGDYLAEIEALARIADRPTEGRP